MEIDLDEHREALKAGLDEAILMLRTFTTDGSSDSRRQATIDLLEVEHFAASLAAIA